MKKHLFTFVLALLLAALASAAAAQEYYTLPEIREQAAQGWHQTYTDKYGRTRQVDVDIDVFGEDAAPVVKACWGTKYFNLSGPAGNPLDLVAAARNKNKGTETYLYENTSYMKVNLDQKYAEGYENDLTLREVYDFCEEVMQGQGLSLYQDYMWEQPYWFWVEYSADNKTGGVLIPAVYYIRLCQKEFGLPILTHVGHSFEHTQVAFDSPFVSFTMQSRDAQSCVGEVFDVAEVLAEDIPLCSVETAIEGARAFIENGWVHDVTGLHFGYVVYSDPETNWSKRPPSDDVDTWYLVPSWVMDCRVLWNPKEDDPEKSYDREMVINAQTGEMIDYFDTSLNGGGDMRYKGFISWDDVK